MGNTLYIEHLNQRLTQGLNFDDVLFVLHSLTWVREP